MNDIIHINIKYTYNKKKIKEENKRRKENSFDFILMIKKAHQKENGRKTNQNKHQLINLLTCGLHKIFSFFDFFFSSSL